MAMVFIETMTKFVILAASCCSGINRRIYIVFETICSDDKEHLFFLDQEICTMKFDGKIKINRKRSYSR